MSSKGVLVFTSLVIGRLSRPPVFLPLGQNHCEVPGRGDPHREGKNPTATALGLTVEKSFLSTIPVE